MNKKDELLALAERCEKAEHSSFALECEIAKAIGAFAMPPRNYTVSLDAAMTLVPEGWLMAGLWERNTRLPNWRWKAELWSPDADANVSAIARNSDVPALALCAAALRARAEMEG